MISTIRQSLLVVILLAVASQAVQFKSVYVDSTTRWRDPEVLLWPAIAGSKIPANEFCMALRRNNSAIGNPSCRIAGDWQRDSSLSLYSTWLQNNISANLGSADLKARAPVAQKRLRDLVDQTVVILIERSDTLWLARFQGGSATPNAVAAITDYQNPVATSDALASAWFQGPTERRLTAAERANAANAPDPYYNEKPLYDAWVGIAYGYSQAKIPLTPSNWYSSKLSSRIRNYRIVRDSLSAWSFITDDSPLLEAHAGASFFGFLGLEMSFRYTNYSAKIDPADTLYNELDHWDFDRYEFGLGCLLTRPYTLNETIEARPYFFLSFLYSFMVEDIAVKDGRTPSNYYKTRFQFEDFYRGGMAGLGTRFVYNRQYAFDVRGGFAARGRSLDKEPSPDAVAEPTIIGGATFDGFVQAGFEYHWQWK